MQRIIRSQIVGVIGKDRIIESNKNDEMCINKSDS